MDTACEDMSSLLEQTLNKGEESITKSISDYSEYLNTEKNKMQEYLTSFYKHSAFRKVLLFITSVASILSLVCLVICVLCGFNLIHI